MKELSNEILNAINTYKFDDVKPILSGVFVRNDEVAIADGLSLHILKNRDDTGLNTVLSSKDLKVAQKGIDKKLPFSLLDEAKMTVNGVAISEIEGKYPDYKQILQSEYAISVRLDIKLLMNMLQTIQKLGADMVELSVYSHVKPVAFKGIKRFKQDSVECHKVSILMPIMSDLKPIETSSVLGTYYPELEPDVFPEHLRASKDPLSEDLPF